MRLLIGLLGALALSACGSDATNPKPERRSGPPALGAQIDRDGRPLVNLLLTDPLATATGKTHSEMLDEYNRIESPGAFVSDYRERFAGNLAMLDAADGICGNQLAAGNDPNNRDRYDTLAAVLADDRLVVDRTGDHSSLYLGPELGGMGQALPKDRGGRSPNQNVVDETYSLLVAGPGAMNADGTFAVTDGLSRSPNESVSDSVFPFLAPP